MSSASLTPNQVVAHNVRQARLEAGLTQEEAAELVAPYLGSVWSKAVWSAMERSVDGARIREFTADDLVAFARAFELPLIYFLLPPIDKPGILAPNTGASGTLMSGEIADLLIRNDDMIVERLEQYFGDWHGLTSAQRERWNGVVAERAAMLHAEARNLDRQASTLREVSSLLRWGAEDARAVSPAPIMMGQRRLWLASGKLARALEWDGPAVDVWAERLYGHSAVEEFKRRYDEYVSAKETDAEANSEERERLTAQIQAVMAEELKTAAEGSGTPDRAARRRRRARPSRDRDEVIDRQLARRRITEMLEKFPRMNSFTPAEYVALAADFLHHYEYERLPETADDSPSPGTG